MIKEKTETCGVIRLGHYGSGLDVISGLVAEAKKDFPSLTDGDINITQYGGRYYKGTFGIEFQLPEMGDSSGYAKIRDLEYKAA